jgi:hypothetical protein
MGEVHHYHDDLARDLRDSGGAPQYHQIASDRFLRHDSVDVAGVDSQARRGFRPIIVSWAIRETRRTMSSEVIVATGSTGKALP